MLVDVKIMMVVHVTEKYWMQFEVISILSWWKHPPLGGTGMTSKLATPKANSNFKHASMFVCFVHCVPGTCVQLLLLGITCAPSRLVYCCTGLETRCTHPRVRTPAGERRQLTLRPTSPNPPCCSGVCTTHATTK